MAASDIEERNIRYTIRPPSLRRPPYRRLETLNVDSWVGLRTLHTVEPAKHESNLGLSARWACWGTASLTAQKAPEVLSV